MYLNETVVDAIDSHFNCKMIGVIGFAISFCLLFSDITAQDDCSDCRCCTNGDCNSSGTCTSGCKNGYWNSRCDKTCTSNCVRCLMKNGDYCYDCQQGYYVRNNNVCIKCYFSGCSCTSNYGCDECLEGYYDPSRRCIECPNHCNKCTSSSSCSSCKQGFYGSYCQYLCGTDCINGVCDSDRAVCDCKKGFAGTHCEDCAIGRYGPECQYLCSSGCVDRKCERATGTCICKTGWTGSKCNKCLPKYYGNQCSLCREECSECDEYNSCQSCISGQYGSYCQNTCGKGCVNNECCGSNGPLANQRKT